MAKDAELEHFNALLGEASQHKQETAFQSIKCAYDNPSWVYDMYVALLPVDGRSYEEESRRCVAERQSFGFAT